MSNPYISPPFIRPDIPREQQGTVGAIGQGLSGLAQFLTGLKQRQDQIALARGHLALEQESFDAQQKQMRDRNTQLQQAAGALSDAFRKSSDPKQIAQAILPILLGSGQDVSGITSGLLTQMGQAQQPFDLGPGQTRFGAGGTPIASVPENPVVLPSGANLVNPRSGKTVAAGQPKAGSNMLQQRISTAMPGMVAGLNIMRQIEQGDPTAVDQVASADAANHVPVIGRAVEAFKNFGFTQNAKMYLAARGTVVEAFLSMHPGARQGAAMQQLTQIGLSPLAGISSDPQALRQFQDLRNTNLMGYIGRLGQGELPGEDQSSTGATAPSAAPVATPSLVPTAGDFFARGAPAPSQ
jgi:hypothetical protein